MPTSDCPKCHRDDCKRWDYMFPFLRVNSGPVISLCSFKCHSAHLKEEAKEQETSWFENSFKTALYVLNCRYGNTINPICAHSEWLTMPVWAECCLEMTLNLLWTRTKIRPCHSLFCSSLAKAFKVRFKNCYGPVRKILLALIMVPPWSFCVLLFCLV